MQFRILGPLEVRHDGDVVPLGGPKHSKVLAVLLLEANHAVPLHRLIDALWGEHPPATAKRQVQNAVAALRRVLAAVGNDPIERTGDSYRLTTTDLDRLDFASEVAQARSHMASGEVHKARELLSRALDRWRGPALAGSADGVIASAADRLDEARLSAIEDLIDVELQLGRNDAAIERARQVLTLNPFRQKAAHQMMLALHRSGRDAEALQVYTELRATLADELGLDPEARLQELHRQILRNEVPAPETAPRHLPVPAQLPADLRGFTGREPQLAELDAILEHDSAAMPIIVIAGTAGVGKTALATHWAHRIADRFGDGQLYANLRGFDRGQPVSPETAVRGFLDALEVAPERIPYDLDAQVGLYRSLLAERRMLVVLDNARDVGQVRPLLPGGGECLVVVTSRNQLSGLVAAEDAHPVVLEPPTEREAHAMLSRRLGLHRVAAELEATVDIIEACSRLPLALALVSARAALNPQFRLLDLAAELRDEHHRLDALAAGDAADDVRAVFSWSYQSVSADAAHIFRVLGLHPGPDIAVPAAASLAGLPTRAVRALLAELASAHLVTEHRPGRFTLHDLLRDYASELADHHEPEAERHAALHRVLDHYLHSAHTADRLLAPTRDDIALAPARPGVTTAQPQTYVQAMHWFSTEHQGLLAALERAAESGFGTHAWQLAWSLSNFLDYRGHWHDMESAWRTGIDAGHPFADPATHGRALRVLAYACLQTRQYEAAHRHLEQALKLSSESSDTGRAHTHSTLGYIYYCQGRYADALAQSQLALEHFQNDRHTAGQARALNAIGWCQALLGDHHQALANCEQALRLHQEGGNRHGEAGTLDSLGYAHHHLGYHRQSIRCYQRALAIYRDLGDLRLQAEVHLHLGDARHDADDHPAAEASWHEALAILDDLNHPRADEVRTRLKTLTTPGGP